MGKAWRCFTAGAGAAAILLSLAPSAALVQRNRLSSRLGADAATTPAPGAAGGSEDAGDGLETAEVTNPSGVNVTSVAEIQGDMGVRAQELQEKAADIAAELDQVERNNPADTFAGVDIDAEVVDPSVVAQEVESVEKQRENDRDVRALQELLTGKLSPPIIILEPPGEDPTEKLMLLKLTACQKASQQVSGARQQLESARTAAANASDEEPGTEELLADDEEPADEDDEEE